MEAAIRRVAAVLALALCAASGSDGPAAQAAAPPAGRPDWAEANQALVEPLSLPLHTQGRYVVDVNGRRVRLLCVNWYGAHLEQMVVNGLNRQPLRQIARTIAKLGFNCVRLPFNLEMLFGNATQVPNPKISLRANPELMRFSPLEVFDATIAELSAQGLMTILNNHVSSPGWCCSLTDGEGLWYTERYNESAWLDALGLMTARYRHNPLVAGFDIRNEIRPSLLGSPTWGEGGPTDWSSGAVRGAERVLSENEGMLVIVSGIFYSIFLCDIPRRPIHVLYPGLRGRIVYTAHEYNWFNFHLVARGFITSYVGTLTTWCGLLWLLLALATWFERLGERRCPAPQWLMRLIRWAYPVRPQSEESQRRCCWGVCLRLGCPLLGLAACEVSIATLLTVASLLGLTWQSMHLQVCSIVDLGKSMAFLALTLLCMLLSLLLWMRVALACMQGLQMDIRRELSGRDLAAMLAAEGGDAADESGSPRAGPGETQITSAGFRVEDGVAVCAPPEDRGSSDVPLRSPTEASFASAGWESSGTAPAQPARSLPFRARRCTGVVGSLRTVRCLALGVNCVIVGFLSYIAQVYGKYETFEAELHSRWGFLLDGSLDEAHTAPVWIGEFGAQDEDRWWRYTLRYMREHEVEWAYWSINGQKNNNETEPFGLLMDDSKTMRDPWKMEGLKELMRASPVPVGEGGFTEVLS